MDVCKLAVRSLDFKEINPKVQVNKALGGGPGFHRAHTVRVYKSSVKQWCIFVEGYVVFEKVDDTIACLCNRLIAFRATMGLLLGAIKSERLVEMS